MHTIVTGIGSYAEVAQDNIMSVLRWTCSHFLEYIGAAPQNLSKCLCICVFLQI